MQEEYSQSLTAFSRMMAKVQSEEGDESIHRKLEINTAALHDAEADVAGVTQMVEFHRSMSKLAFSKEYMQELQSKYDTVKADFERLQQEGRELRRQQKQMNGCINAVKKTLVDRLVAELQASSSNASSA